MEWILVPAGALLILVGFLDVFFTVLHYDGFGFLSSRLYDSLFKVMRSLTRPLPRRYRALGLSMAAPLMVPVTITVWVLLVSLGYALVYYAGMDGDALFSLPGKSLEPSPMEALYLSGVAVSTLGFGDITPTNALYQALVVSEALIGFGILTLAISYIIGVYGVLQQLGVLSAGCTIRPRIPTTPGPSWPLTFRAATRLPWSRTSWSYTGDSWRSTKGCAATPSSTTTTAAGPTARCPSPFA
jgi:hypothetical protein